MAQEQSSFSFLEGVVAVLFGVPLLIFFLSVVISSSRRTPLDPQTQQAVELSNKYNVPLDEVQREMERIKIVGPRSSDHKRPQPPGESWSAAHD